MRYFPMFLDMAGRRVLLAGGGEQIAQKARLLTRTEAALTAMAKELVPELQAHVDAGRIAHAPSDLDEAEIGASHYVFIATGDETLDSRIAEQSRRAGALVNMVDKPEACDMITPALVDRDPVVVAIGTEGAAPVLGRAIKSSLEQTLSPRLGPFIEMIRSWRERVAAEVDERERLGFWRWAIRGAPWRRWLAGDEEGARRMIGDAIDAGRAPDGPDGGVTVIEAPEAPDLTPLRAVERLQEARAIFHGVDLDDGVLELARRDALRFPLSSCPRGGVGMYDVAAEAEKGPVVIVAPRGCEAAFGGVAGADVIRAAPDS